MGLFRTASVKSAPADPEMQGAREGMGAVVPTPSSNFFRT